MLIKKNQVLISKSTDKYERVILHGTNKEIDVESSVQRGNTASQPRRGRASSASPFDQIAGKRGEGGGGGGNCSVKVRDISYVGSRKEKEKEKEKENRNSRKNDRDIDQIVTMDRIMDGTIDMFGNRTHVRSSSTQGRPRGGVRVMDTEISSTYKPSSANVINIPLRHQSDIINSIESSSSSFSPALASYLSLPRNAHTCAGDRGRGSKISNLNIINSMKRSNSSNMIRDDGSKVHRKEEDFESASSWESLFQCPLRLECLSSSFLYLPLPVLSTHLYQNPWTEKNLNIPDEEDIGKDFPKN